MGRRLMVAILVAITALYCWALLWMSIGFARAGGLVGWGLAAGVFLLMVLTVWVTWREVLFGIASMRLGRAWDGPAPQRGPREEFEQARAAVEQGGEADWRAWYRLSLAYDALRDRKNARMALRRAIDVERRER